MLVSDTTYLIIVASIAAIIIAFPLYFEYIKKKGKNFRVLYFLLLLLLPFNWYTPTVYTVTVCDVYTKEILIFATEKDGYKFEIGWYNYIVNKSNEKLYYENIFYGSNARQEDEIDVEIAPNSIERVNTVTINYVFTNPPESVSSKSNGETKTALYCIN